MSRRIKKNLQKQTFLILKLKKNTEQGHYRKLFIRFVIIPHLCSYESEQNFCKKFAVFPCPTNHLFLLQLQQCTIKSYQRGSSCVYPIWLWNCIVLDFYELQLKSYHHHRMCRLGAKQSVHFPSGFALFLLPMFPWWCATSPPISLM